MAKNKNPLVVNSSGKRKTAIARATVTPGKGRVRVNSEPIEILRPEMARTKAMEPLVIADAMGRLADVDINVNTTGGGQMGQVDAIRTAIARGLVFWNQGKPGKDDNNQPFKDTELRDEFIRFDRSLLVNDPRRKEPKHQMGRGARAKWQKSYR
jgi:small subunit ribosomal protein S9|tara:strand:+ start:280 stop:741 length:462 start_codon:yes stop_codon:yes gene_type:complete